MYMHDILFKAGLHPLRKISDMNEKDIERLYHSILEALNYYRSKMDFWGKEGMFGIEDFIIGYKDNNEPCPVCSEPIVLIKTGSTSSYICLACQKL